MLSQKTLNVIDELQSNPLISSISIQFAQWHKLPEINIHSVKDVSEIEVLVLIETNLCPVEVANFGMDFDHINAQGNSYHGKTDEARITLITSTTKEKAPAIAEDKENLSPDYTSDMEVTQ